MQKADEDTTQGQWVPTRYAIMDEEESQEIEKLAEAQIARTITTVDQAEQLALLAIVRFREGKERRAEILLGVARLMRLQLEPWNVWNSADKLKNLFGFMFDWAMETCPTEHHAKLAEGFNELWSDPEADAIEADVAGAPSDKANDPG
ncbi:hypothetical protein UFOVP75_178 [uncultured Caudovirales phage]|uniref:Uncharacterized protein n=1 Tax=uncultured Caudovirales phage TaxID=2100421 RepID=A0A6J5KZB2_9CAUD|nr:hypothetical protein UFOVP75_178 [uncultured Caudovirales phage]